VAVVGSRLASGYGRRTTVDLCEGLARYGIAVVSGLARGIDAEAHSATLRAGGRTIAVLGCGIDVTYPSEHHRLQSSIPQHGAIVSEFPMGAAPDAENFPARNRIISGMTLGTIVVEAAEKSGSLITAQFALEQGREVFAVPGPIGARSRGGHRLLRQGASLVDRAEDVVQAIAPHILAVRDRKAPRSVDGPESGLLACLSRTPKHVDDVIRESGLSAAAVLDGLLRLELQGLIEQLPGKSFVRREA
jgi:DNA processing protein